jgi:hypothetical protein
VEIVIRETGHQTVEVVLVLSAKQVSGTRTPGKASGDIRHHGSRPGHVELSDKSSHPPKTPFTVSATSWSRWALAEHHPLNPQRNPPPPSEVSMLAR